ncbi:NAD(P)-binding domain-containing protein [Cynara cardunculus var. scolymus]|uniref:NAD(P)-binding domain-containing protein n=1 Tax=Cynara cardunculus var. scolymus TaxID=59895 RepID=A0A118JSM4_CYNCS|nr:NAD(P)-binding domain-containing protein [Cynara cardunculus var. scolymus]
MADYEIPLDLIGEPLERFIRATTSFTKPLSSLPAVDRVLAPPICVDDVAVAAVNAVRETIFWHFYNRRIKIEIILYESFNQSPPPPPHRREPWFQSGVVAKMSSSLSYAAPISRLPSSHSPNSTPLFPSSIRSHVSYPISHTNRLLKFGVKCSYADAGIKDTNSVTIDVEANIKAEKIVVLGGSGFVGSAICKAAVSRGIEVISLSRSGRPTTLSSWEDQVTWITGDVFYVNWDEVLPGATAVISTLGGFGSEEQMQRINGEANVIAVTAAKEYGIPKFILISVHDYNIPSFLLSSGYFTGKRKAESEIMEKVAAVNAVKDDDFFGIFTINQIKEAAGGVKVKMADYEIPLDLIGEPLERFIRATTSFTKPLSSLPAVDRVLAPPICVDDVAVAAVNAVKDDDFFGIFTINQIKEAAGGVKV